MKTGVKLSSLYDDVPRLAGGVYLEEFVPLYVQNLLSLVKGRLDLEYVIDIFRSQLKSWGVLHHTAGDYDWSECCCAVAPPVQYQSINMGRRMRCFSKNHEAIVEVIRGVFDVEYRECRGVESMWSRVYDLKGSKVALLSFIPVLDFLLNAYEVVMFVCLRKLRGCSMKEKQGVRAEVTAWFVSALQEECLNFREGRL